MKAVSSSLSDVAPDLPDLLRDHHAPHDRLGALPKVQVCFALVAFSLHSQACLLTVCFRGCSYTKALMFLVYSYQYNQELLSGGLYRGHSQELIGCYRRACLQVRRVEQGGRWSKATGGARRRVEQGSGWSMRVGGARWRVEHVSW